MPSVVSFATILRGAVRSRTLAFIVLAAALGLLGTAPIGAQEDIAPLYSMPVEPLPVVSPDLSFALLSQPINGYGFGTTLDQMIQMCSSNGIEEGRAECSNLATIAGATLLNLRNAPGASASTAREAKAYMWAALRRGCVKGLDVACSRYAVEQWAESQQDLAKRIWASGPCTRSARCRNDEGYFDHGNNQYLVSDQATIARELEAQRLNNQQASNQPEAKPAKKMKEKKPKQDKGPSIWSTLRDTLAPPGGDGGAPGSVFEP